MRDWIGSTRDLEWIFANGNRGMHKHPSDLARYERIIETVRPAVLLEIGLLYGGSLNWFAERVPRVVNVELHGKHITELLNNEYPQGCPENATLIHGLSYGEFTFPKITDALGTDAPVMVVLDSDHATETVLMELRKLAGLVSVGSYCVVEDGILAHYAGNWYAGNPLEAIELFLAEDDRFVPDMEIEDMSDRTQHPSGWLKRVK